MSAEELDKLKELILTIDYRYRDYVSMVQECNTAHELMGKRGKKPFADLDYDWKLETLDLQKLENFSDELEEKFEEAQKLFFKKYSDYDSEDYK